MVVTVNRLSWFKTIGSVKCVQMLLFVEMNEDVQDTGSSFPDDRWRCIPVRGGEIFLCNALGKQYCTDISELKVRLCGACDLLVFVCGGAINLLQAI